MATIAFDAQNAVKDLKAAGANEDLARAVVRIIGESTAKDAIPRDKTFESAKLKLALGDLEVRITNRFAWISLGVLGVSIFSSLMLSISLLASQIFTSFSVASTISNSVFAVMESKSRTAYARGMTANLQSPNTSRATAVASPRDAVRAMASIGEIAAVNLSAVPLLSVRDLNVHFPITRGFILQKTVGHIRAVNGVSFHVNPGETLGIVGESGSGKTTVVRAVIQLQTPTSGSVVFQGDELVGASSEVLRGARRNMSLVFQDPYGSLNPRMRAGNIVGEPLRAHHVFESKNEYLDRVAELFQMVGLHPGVASRYPHQFSGGQRQRIAIARSLAANPRLILLDEPVSALDVSIQAQVINLLEDLQDEQDLAYVFVAHDLSVVRHTAHRTAVMYLGKIVEIADGDEIYDNPLHPYTQALLSAAPMPDPVLERKRKRIVLTGDIPSPANPPSGCVFRTRCPIAIDDCAEIVPQMRSTGSLTRRHEVACIRAEF